MKTKLKEIKWFASTIYACITTLILLMSGIFINAFTQTFTKEEVYTVVICFMVVDVIAAIAASMTLPFTDEGQYISEEEIY